MDEIRYSKELRESIYLRSGKKTATNKGDTSQDFFSQSGGSLFV